MKLSENRRMVSQRKLRGQCTRFGLSQDAWKTTQLDDQILQTSLEFWDKKITGTEN